MQHDNAFKLVVEARSYQPAAADRRRLHTAQGSMGMIHRVLLTLGCSVLMSTSVAAREYLQGQVWSYHTRPGEESSTLLINRVEELPVHGKVFHISVRAVRVKNPHHPDGVTTELPHFPVSSATLDDSCVEVVGESEPDPGYLKGYEAWRSAFDAGGAGVFSIPVAEIVSFIETSIAGE